MAITKNPDRQDVLVSRTTIGFADLANDDGTVEAFAAVPAGAVIIGGHVTVDEAFDSTTSDVIDIGDGGDPDRYTASPLSIATITSPASASAALTISGYEYTAKDTIDVGWTAGSTGTATAGQISIVLEYVVDGRSAFVQK